MPQLLAAILLACTPEPASIDVAGPVLLQRADPVTLQARALDGTGRPIEKATVSALGSSAPELLRIGHDGRVQCLGNGTATVTLGSGDARGEVEVECLLVREIRAPRTRRLVLGAVPEGGADYPFQVIGLDGREAGDVAPELRSTDPTVVQVLQDESGFHLRPVTPGTAEIHVRVGPHQASTRVVVGHEALRREGLSLADGEAIGLPVGPGTWRITVVSTEPVEVEARGGDCSESEPAATHHLDCRFEAAGTLRVRNPGLGVGAAATVHVRGVLFPS